MFNLCDGCLKGSPQWKNNIAKAVAERSEDFVFYTDAMGDWHFSELVEALREDDELVALGIGEDAVKNYIFENLERLCAFDVPSMYIVIKTAFGCESSLLDPSIEEIDALE